MIYFFSTIKNFSEKFQKKVGKRVFSFFINEILNTNYYSIKFFFVISG